MRSSLLSRAPLFLTLTFATACVALGVACGGKEEPKTPAGVGTGDTASAADAGATPSSGTTKPGETPGTGGTTTTSQLDASDLQGAKLSSSSRKEIETKGDGGPKVGPGGRSDEPGRRREDIQTIVQTHRDEARACYDKGLQDHPGIEGDLDVKWTIDPNGAVTDIAVDHGKSQIHEESVGNCVVEVIKKIKFASSAKGFETHAHYPFNFHPKNTPGAKKDAGR